MKKMFATTVAPYLAAGWDHAAMLPGIPGLKRPGRWVGMKWVGLKGGGLLKRGLEAAETPTSWDEIQAWPTPTICMRGSLYPAIDIDSESEQVQSLVRLAVPQCRTARGREGSNRALLPFRADGEVKHWPLIQFKLPGSDEIHKVEFNGHGKQWLACGPHPKGGSYLWEGLEPGAAPLAADLPTITQAEADEIRGRLVAALRQVGSDFLDGSDEMKRARVDTLERVLTDDLEPTIPPELMAKVLAEIPDTRETVGGWDEAIPLLASMRRCLGSEGVFPPDFLLDWTCEFPESSYEWALERWESFADGVEVGPGTFLEFVRKNGTPELYAEVQGHVDRGRVTAGFAGCDDAGEVEDEGEDPGLPIEPLKKTPNLAETVAFLLKSPAWQGVVGWCEFRNQVMLRKPLPALTKRRQAGFVERPWTDADDAEALMWCQCNGLPKLGKQVAI